MRNNRIESKHMAGQERRRTIAVCVCVKLNAGRDIVIRGRREFRIEKRSSANFAQYRHLMSRFIPK